MQTLNYKIFKKWSVQFYVDWASSFFAVQPQELVLLPAGAGEKKSGMLPTWRRYKISACECRRECFLSRSQLQWQRRCNLVHDEAKGGVCVCVCERAGGTLEEHTPGQTEVMRLPLQGIRAVSAQQRDSCEHSGWLQLCQVSMYDTGVYFCDRQTTDNWIFRRAVNVTVVRKCCQGARIAN